MKKAWAILSISLCALFTAGISSGSYTQDLVAAHRIDSSYQQIWKEKGIQPAYLSTDEEFLRRATLDITGRIPTAVQASAFLSSSEPQKRQVLIGQLLESPEFADYFASTWTALFLGYRNDRFVDRMAFQEWLQNEIRKNTGWDRIAQAIITAEGSLGDNPPLNWYARHKLEAPNLADDTSRLFLGIQLGCARCHNHPHDQWKLEDFYGLAAFYSGLKREDLDRVDKQKVRDLKRKRKQMMDEYKSEKEAKSKRPEEIKQMKEEFRDVLRLTQEPTDSIQAEIKGEMKVYQVKFLMDPKPAHFAGNQRVALAEWITSPQNTFFAKALVNRIWGMMMGSGFVDPVDDMGQLNAPSNPELLSFLAEDFKQHSYSIKHLVSSIANSKTYQLSSKARESGPPDWYERGKVQILNADQMMNSLLTATSIETALKLKTQREYEERRQMIYQYHVFLFENDDSKGSAEFSGTIPQALFTLNGKLTNEAIQPHIGNTISTVMKERSKPEARIDLLFLSTVSRHPTPDELATLTKHLHGQTGELQAYEDMLWALLNSNEFLFNH